MTVRPMQSQFHGHFFISIEITGPNGRWKESNLAKLLGEEPAPVEERVVQTLELTPINKQPFSSVHA